MLTDKIRSKRVRVAVIGDSMLDIYKYGKVNRISPEFPVPILHSTDLKQEHFPGGAANVYYQFKHMNADVQLFSPLDWEASDIFSDIGFNIDGCVILPEGEFIPRKIRYYDDEFPLLRQDIEVPNFGTQDMSPVRDRLLANFIKSNHDCKFDVVILSNYNKGTFNKGFAQNAIEHCNVVGVPTIVDPKDNLDWWTGCSYVKPNAAEAVKMTGEKDWGKQCEIFRKHVEMGVIVTQAGSGIVGMDNGGLFEHRPRTTIKDVNSVIGAGDCFVAVMGLAIAHGETLRDSVKYGFLAGTQYVKERHNRPITVQELHRQVDPLGAKIVSVSELQRLRNGVYKGYKWVLSNGVFDVTHFGHVVCLQTAKSHGDKLIVAINSDESVRRLKGSSRPIIGLEDRMKMVAALECVDFVVSFDEDVPFNVVDALRPDVLVKGSDYRDREISGSNLVGKVVLVDLVPGLSTTDIIGKIKAGDK